MLFMSWASQNKLEVNSTISSYHTHTHTLPLLSAMLFLALFTLILGSALLAC